MTDSPKPFAQAKKYTIRKEDIIGMMKSGIPNEEVDARIINAGGILGWEILVIRPIYGEEYQHNSFISLAMVEAGPEWVEEQQRIIDTAFEKTRAEHPKAMH